MSERPAGVYLLDHSSSFSVSLFKTEKDANKTDHSTMSLSSDDKVFIKEKWCHNADRNFESFSSQSKIRTRKIETH